MDKILFNRLIFILFLSIFFSTQNVYAGWDWNDRIERRFKNPPLDVAESIDGQTLFVLTPGEILIYSTAGDRVENRISVDQGYDRIVYSYKNNTLILTGRSNKSLKIIQLQKIFEFDLSGLAVLGSDTAPITVVVFSDYQ